MAAPTNNARVIMFLGSSWSDPTPPGNPVKGFFGLYGDAFANSRGIGSGEESLEFRLPARYIYAAPDSASQNEETVSTRTARRLQLVVAILLARFSQ